MKKKKEKPIIKYDPCGVIMNISDVNEIYHGFTLNGPVGPKVWKFEFHIAAKDKDTAIAKLLIYLRIELERLTKSGY